MRLRTGAFVAVVGLLVLGGAAWADEAEEKAKAEAKPDEPDIQYVEGEAEDEEEPANPFGAKEAKKPGALPGTVVLSDGKKLSGDVRLTRDKKLRFYHREKKKLLLLTLAELERIECRVLEEHMEPEWRWRENANDEKVYTGKHYPMRKLETVLHLKTGKTLVGDCTALLYVGTDNGESRFVIHKRQKGEVGQTLKDLIYVKEVDLRPPTKDTAPEGEKKERK